MVVIHWWRSRLRQSAHARTIDEYDVTVLVPRVDMTSQINCGDVIMLSQKRLSLATMAKWAINDRFSIGNLIYQWLTSSLVKIIGKSPHSWPKKIVIHGNSCIILYYNYVTAISISLDASLILPSIYNQIFDIYWTLVLMFKYSQDE